MMMLTNDGLFRQIDGLAMGSPPVPMLANGWLSEYDSTIKGDAMIYSRYMDDILKDIHKSHIDETLNMINDLHPTYLKHTVQRETDNRIVFLDMEIHCVGNSLQST